MCAGHRESLESSRKPVEDSDVEVLCTKKYVDLLDSDHSQMEESDEELEILSTNIRPTSRGPRWARFLENKSGSESGKTMIRLRLCPTLFNSRFHPPPPPPRDNFFSQPDDE